MSKVIARVFLKLLCDDPTPSPAPRQGRGVLGNPGKPRLCVALPGLPKYHTLYSRNPKSDQWRCMQVGIHVSSQAGSTLSIGQRFPGSQKCRHVRSSTITTGCDL